MGLYRALLVTCRTGDLTWRDGAWSDVTTALRYTIGQRRPGVAMAHPVYVTGVTPPTTPWASGEAEDSHGHSVTLNDWIWSAPADRGWRQSSRPAAFAWALARWPSCDRSNPYTWRRQANAANF